MTLSKTQEKAILLIRKMESEFGKRWFIHAELGEHEGITLHTTKALVNKGYLEEKDFDGLPYYQSTW